MATPPSKSDPPHSSNVTTSNPEGVITVTVTKDNTSNAYKIFSLASRDGGEEKTKPFELQVTDAHALPDEFHRLLFRALPPHLSGGDIHVLISILSGTGLALSFFDEILQPVLRAIGLVDTRYNVVRTTGAESVKEFAKDRLLVGANNGKKQTVLMLSGDGGIVDTINGLLEAKTRSDSYIKPTILLFPLGTGNALFHSLHKPSPLPSLYIQGLRTLLDGTPQPLPIFRATFSPGSRLLTNESRTATSLPNNTLYGAVVASCGIHATLVADSDTPEYRKHGDKRFGLVAKDLLFPEGGGMPHRYQVDVILRKGDREERMARDEHGYLLMSLVSNLEKAFTISPHSKPLDGKLRIVHFAPLGGEQAMAIMTAAYDAGKHVEREEVGYESVDGVKVEFREQGEEWKWRRCCIDGLIVGVEEGGWMEVSLVQRGGEVVDVVVD